MDPKFGELKNPKVVNSKLKGHRSHPYLRADFLEDKPDLKALAIKIASK